MLDQLVRGLQAINEDQFTYFEIGKAFEVTLNRIEANSVIPSHFHTSDVFNVVLDGEIDISIDGKEVPYRKGDCIFLKAYQSHAVTTNSSVTLLEFWRR